MTTTRPNLSSSLNRLRLVGVASLSIAVMTATACQTEDDGSAMEDMEEMEADSDSTEMCEGAEPQLDCGTILLSDACDEDPAVLGDPSASDCSGNEDAATCAIEAAVAGDAFTLSVRRYTNFGQFDTGRTLHVEAAGAGFGSGGGVEDLCSGHESFRFEGFDPSGCDSVDCVVDATYATRETLSCVDEMSCDGGV